MIKERNKYYRERKTEFRRKLSSKQRKWARRVFGGKCHFLKYSERQGWFLCESQKEIQIHHIVPSGYSLFVLNENPHRPDNLIALCACHHIGKGWKGYLKWRSEVVPVIHPDIEWARRHYRGMGELTSYDQVFNGRQERVDKNKTYWNTDWDRMLKEVVEEKVIRYLIEHPEDQFPL